MKIVILDAYTSNPGDLSWEGLENFGELKVYERTVPEQVLERCSGCEAVLTNKVVLNAEIMDQLPDLKYIGVLATGTNVVDLNFAKERGNLCDQYPGLQYGFGSSAYPCIYAPF
jgi:glycerate dehydrogenase